MSVLGPALLAWARSLSLRVAAARWLESSACPNPATCSGYRNWRRASVLRLRGLRKSRAGIVAERSRECRKEYVSDCKYDFCRRFFFCRKGIPTSSTIHEGVRNCLETDPKFVFLQLFATFFVTSIGRVDGLSKIHFAGDGGVLDHYLTPPGRPPTSGFLACVAHSFSWAPPPRLPPSAPAP